MRLKSFTAPTMQEAMQMVRNELGEEAIIVSVRQSRRKGGEVRITAAVEEPAFDGSPAEGGGGDPRPAASAQALEVIRSALEHHGTPGRLVERIVSAARILGSGEPTAALAAALDDGFRFAPLPERGFEAPIMLVGPPGAGKTTGVAKLAARAVLAGAPVRLITADAVRAGATQQLAAFARLMNVDLVEAHGVHALREAVAVRGPDEIVVIDSAGVNPFDAAEMSELAALSDAAGTEPVLVLGAGGDALDSAETAQFFAAIGADRLFATKLDAARRLGGLLAAADAAPLKFCNVSLSASVAKAPHPMSAPSLARLLVSPSSRQRAGCPTVEAVS
jgi:flagellar biosynthesis protein FlhF